MNLLQKLFEGSEKSSLSNEDRISTAIEGQLGANWISFANLYTQIKNAIVALFANKTTLDKLAESNGELTFNNVPLSKSGAILVDKGSQASAVVFALGSDSRQKVVATGTTLSIDVSNLPTDFSTTSVIDIIASGNTVALTFDVTIPVTTWIDGDVLSSIANGETYCISITTNGNTKAALLITYAKKGV